MLLLSFVAVFLVGILSTGEAQQNSVTPQGNLAIERPATQSSTFDAGSFDAGSGVLEASRAVDGDYRNDLYAGQYVSCAHTNDGAGGPNWWRVQLDRPYRVEKVVVTNRKDDKANRLDYFFVGVTNSTEDPERGAYPLCGQYPSTVAAGATVTLNCDLNIGAGQYVIIQQPVDGAGFLTLCEVEVYARTCPCGFDYVPEINQCLYLNLEPMTWGNARLACARMKTGAQMAAIKSSAKQAAVRRYLENQFLKLETSVCIWPWTLVAKIAWIDGQTENPTQCGVPYFWKPVVTAATAFDYANWYPGYPNCNGGNENCVIIVSGIDYNYRWDDVRCDMTRCSLCEF